MSYSALKKMAQRLDEQASFIREITNDGEYEQALALMDEIIEDTDRHGLLIHLLSISIDRWENSSMDFAEFNKLSSSGDPALAGCVAYPDGSARPWRCRFA